MYRMSLQECRRSLYPHHPRTRTRTPSVALLLLLHFLYRLAQEGLVGIGYLSVFFFPTSRRVLRDMPCVSFL